METKNAPKAEPEDQEEPEHPEPPAACNETQVVVHLVSDTKVVHKKLEEKVMFCSRHRRKLLLGLIILLVVFAFVLGFCIWYFQALPLRVALVNHDSEKSDYGKCISVRLGLCHKYKVPYKDTILPNGLGHNSPEEAIEAMSRYETLISVKCYKLLPFFLCSLYSPKCVKGKIVPPCRSLCYEARRKCDFFLGVFSLTWPIDINCDDLEDDSDPSICFGKQEVENLNKLKQACPNQFRCDSERRCIPYAWVCDGFTDCEDAADERDCSNCTDHFRCGSKECVDMSSVCDGVRDCADGSDERQCLRLSKQQSFIGEGRLETYNATAKKWVPVCAENWDSTSWSSKACKMLGYRQVNETKIRDEVSVIESPSGSIVGWKNFRESLFDRHENRCSSSSVSVHLKCTDFVCGHTADSMRQQAQITPRIVGGKESSPGKWPWLVALHGGPEEVFFCGGVLLSSWWVLTAAHCAGNLTDPGGWTLKIGMTRRSSYLSSAEIRKIQAIVKHPNFDSYSLYNNDIALLLLSKPVSFGEFLRPVCLPPRDAELKFGSTCTVIGWGKGEFNDDADYHMVVHEAKVPLVNFTTCQKWYSQQDIIISESMLCAGYETGKIDACQGDSGGPLVCQDRSDERWFVAGIVSWGIKCAQPELPGIYTNVPVFVDWILNVTEEYNHPLYMT